MLQKDKKGFYQLTTLNLPHELTHGFSTVKDGNMHLGQEKNVSNFLKKLGSRVPFVRPNQVHSSRVEFVRGADSGRTLEKVDGLITKTKNLALLVRTADCLPILAVDPVQKIIGTAHSGWRGTRDAIAKNLIRGFVDLGANVQDIKIGFGPCIGPCHYEIKNDVSEQMKTVGLESALRKREEKIYFDLKKANLMQLISVGILEKNIDGLENICTFEERDFYSFRRDKKLQANVGIIVSITSRLV